MLTTSVKTKKEYKSGGYNPPDSLKRKDFNMINTSTIVYRDGVLKHQRINQDFKDLKHLKSWLNNMADELQESTEKIPRDEYNIVTKNNCIVLRKVFDINTYVSVTIRHM